MDTEYLYNRRLLTVHGGPGILGQQPDTSLYTGLQTLWTRRVRDGILWWGTLHQTNFLENIPDARTADSDPPDRASPSDLSPKGVITDWRRFKLDNLDQTVPQKKRELLRQMSTPRDDDRGNRKMSLQEYEMIQDEDEHSLKRYRKQCMQEMHERLSFGPKFEMVHELDSGEAFLEVIEKEHRLTLVMVHIYQHGVKGCEQMNSCLDCLAAEYPTVKFCRIDAVATGAAERFSSEVLPTLLVYKAGELLGNFLAVTQYFNEEFYATDVEAFLNEYGLLPEKEFTACVDEQDKAEEVE